MRTEQSGLRFRKGDAAVTAAVVLFAIGMLAWMLFGPGAGETAASARIYQDGQMIRELSLGEDTEVTVEGLYMNRITVRGGRIAITESSCPGEDCVHSGWIDRPGRSLVCLPNRVEIRLEGPAAEDDVDAVVW